MKNLNKYILLIVSCLSAFILYNFIKNIVLWKSYVYFWSKKSKIESKLTFLDSQLDILKSDLYFFQSYNPDLLPGRCYSGILSPDVLFSDPKKTNTIIDPFVTGNYIGYGQLGWYNKRDRIEGYRKGGLLHYYTDGISIGYIISAGPDGNYEVIREGSMEEINKITLYDPTNGIDSKGDILSIIDCGIKDYNITNEKNIWKLLSSNRKYTSYWTLILSGKEDDKGTGIKINSNGDIIFSARSNSTDLATTDSFDVSYNGKYDIILGKLMKNRRLQWLTYLGGNKYDYNSGIEIDKDNNIYLTGYTFSEDFPITNNPYSLKNGDGFITKIDTNGKLLWSSYIGGTSWNDVCNDIHIDHSSNIYVCGWTSSTDFPIKHPKRKPFQNIHNGGDMDGFLAKLGINGEIIWSTYIGGNREDASTGITSDKKGNIYVTGWTRSRNFPIRKSYQKRYRGKSLSDAFISKFSNDGNLIWSTFLGGSSSDKAFDIETDSQGNIIIVGRTCSSNFPIKNGYFDKRSGRYDAFIAKLNTDGELIWSSYLGGKDNEESLSVAINSKDEIYMVGRSNYAKENEFPEIEISEHSNHGVNYDDTFLAGFSPQGDLFLSTYSIAGRLGGVGNDIDINQNDDIYLTGFTGSLKYSTKRKDIWGKEYPDCRNIYILKYTKRTRHGSEDR